MTAAWPGTLPENIWKPGYRETPRPSFIRSRVDVGPAKVRRRTTIDITDFVVELRMTAAQTELLDTFYTTTLIGGTQPFTWVHHRTGDAITYRFLKKPEMAPGAGTRWIVVMHLEDIP